MKKVFFFVVCLALVVSSAAASLTITSPNGGENWPKGSTKLITWTAAGVSGNVKLVLLKAGVKIGDIVASVPASQQSYSWTAGTYEGGAADPASDYKIRVRTIDNAQNDTSDGTFTIGPSGPAPAFALTSPNGGESWPRGSTRLITWNPGAATGSVRIDLYKGGTSSPHYLGCIKTMTAAATGRYTWPVGDREGMTRAAEGNDYYVVIHAYTPDMRDPGNGPFTIAPAKHVASPKSAATKVSTGGLFGLTNPRRGDHWYKGTGYTITWTTGGLSASPVRLDLLNINGTAVVQPIAENIPNNGKYFWAVPMSLPDAETYYKIRLKTMDGTHVDTSGTFPIAKAKPVSGPPTVKVTFPGGPSQLGTGFTYAIRWTSTCGTSVNGPTDDFFTIELMNGAGSTRIRWLLENARAAYDGGNPDGSHSWHWDWKIPVNEAAGTYRIRVTNLTGHCVGIGEPFQLVYRQEITRLELEPQSVQNCHHTFSVSYPHASWSVFRTQKGDMKHARVGFCWRTWSDDTQYAAYRSRVVFGNEDWYKGKGHVIKATLAITQEWVHPASAWGLMPHYPVLGGVVLLNTQVFCPPEGETGQWPAPAAMGTPEAIDASQGAFWEVDITQAYRALTENGLPDRGVILYSTLDSCPCAPGQACAEYGVAWYDVHLKITFAKDILE